MKKIIIVSLIIVGCFSLSEAIFLYKSTITAFGGKLDYQAGNIYVGTPVLSTEAVNMRYATSTVAGLTISDTPSDNEILKYDAGTGKVNWEADTGAGAGVNYQRFALYSGWKMSDVFNSSDTANTFGSWFDVIGTSGTIIAFHVGVASTTTDAVTIRVWRNGSSTATLSMPAGVSYKKFVVSIDCDEATIIGIDFEDVNNTDPSGGFSVVAILKED